MAISLSRLALRASERLATLVAAMRSTQKTAPVSIHNASRALGPVSCRLNGTTLMPRFRSDGRQLLVETACDRVHLRLGLLESHVRSKSSNDEPEPEPRARAARFPIRDTSCAAPTHPHRVCANWKSAGRMPMIREGTPSSSMRRAYRIERASETGLPEAIADQRQTLPLLGLLGREDCVHARVERRAMERGWARSGRH